MVDNMDEGEFPSEIQTIKQESSETKQGTLGAGAAQQDSGEDAGFGAKPSSGLEYGSINTSTELSAGPIACAEADMSNQSSPGLSGPATMPSSAGAAPSSFEWEVAGSIPAMGHDAEESDDTEELDDAEEYDDTEEFNNVDKFDDTEEFEDIQQCDEQWPECYGSEDDGYEDDGNEFLARALFIDYVDSDVEEPTVDCPERRPRAAPASSEELETADQLSKQFEPVDKFDFKWKTFPSPSIPSESRREAFTDSNCGPKASYATPYDAFVAIWDEKLMQHIVVETNRYAEQQINSLKLAGRFNGSSLSRWKDTCIDELYRFFAVILIMGHVPLVEDFWEEPLQPLPVIAEIMSQERFTLLSRCLHFNNNEKCTPELMGATDAKLFKLQPLLDQLNERFANLYKVSRNLSIHESMFLWKGELLSISQLNHIKACPDGIKMYELCESQTGYTLRCKVHAANSYNPKRAEPISGDTSTVVLDLLEGLHGKGHTVWMEKRFNSPALARELKSQGTDCAGNFNTKRPLVPSKLTQLKIGEVDGCTSGDVDLMVWGRYPPGFISTYHGVEDVIVKGRPIASILADCKICVPSPERSVCLDPELSHYPIEPKHTWYKMFFRRLLYISELNSYVLHSSGTRNMIRNNFRKSLFVELLKRHKVKGHFPCTYGFISGTKTREKRPCARCNKRTKFYCTACDDPLCIDLCFRKYKHI